MPRVTSFCSPCKRSERAFLFWYSVPLFRQALLDPGSHVPRTENLVWSLSAIALMQAGYWLRRRLRPQLPQLRNAFVGYIVLFVAPMSFVLATSVFGFVFIVRRPELQIPTSSYFILIIGLFALFCYTQELEQLGRGVDRFGSPAKRRVSQEVGRNFGLVKNRPLLLP